MLNECIPYYEDGDHITGYCTAAVTGKTFVKVSATRSGGTIDTVVNDPISADGGSVNIATADIGGRIFGVAAYDGAIGALVDVIRGAKMVVPVTAAEAMSAFAEVGVGVNGQAVPAGSATAGKATLNTGVVASNNSITWTSVTAGDTGNDITVTLAAATTANPAGTVTVTGLDIVVYVTVASTTATAVIGYVTGSAAASLLVTAANNSTSTGAGVTGAVSKTSLAGGTAGGHAPEAVGFLIADTTVGADAQVSLY